MDTTHIESLIKNTVRLGEQTEAHIFSLCERIGSRAEVDATIDRLLDAGAVAATVIDGGARFGFLPGLRAA